MAEAEFRFSYNPANDGHELDAYDASQALYGIARSISTLTHYVLNEKIIKQAPALKGAQIRSAPPRAGSFEFLISVLQTDTNPAIFVGAVAAQLSAMVLYDLTKTIFNRLCGKPEEQPKSEFVRRLERGLPGELDALSDTLEEDILRLHRPLIHNVSNVNIFGGSDQLIELDYRTFDYAHTKVYSGTPEEFYGHVTSFNGSTSAGRFWLDDEERTVGFSVDKKVGSLTLEERRMLSTSLDEWVGRLGGQIVLQGATVRSKQGFLKQIFVQEVFLVD